MAKVKLNVGMSTINSAGVAIYMEAGSVQEFSEESAQRLIECQKAVPVDTETPRENRVRERAGETSKPAKRGRPKGSKNKPKTENQAVPQTPPPVQPAAGLVAEDDAAED